MFDVAQRGGNILVTHVALGHLHIKLVLLHKFSKLSSSKVMRLDRQLQGLCEEMTEIIFDPLLVLTLKNERAVRGFAQFFDQFHGLRSHVAQSLSVSLLCHPLYSCSTLSILLESVKPQQQEVLNPAGEVV